MGTTTKPGSDYEHMAYVQEHIDKAALAVGRDRQEQFSDEMSQRLSLNSGDGFEHLEFDSPLEVAFWVWWNAWRKMDPICESLRLARQESVTCGGHTYVLDCVIKPGKSRYHDSTKFEPWWPLVGIELDGHAFHEKTLDQVTYRNQRDRALQQAGWHVFHFSFSEFSRDPYTAVLEVIEFMRERESAMWTAWDRDRRAKMPAAERDALVERENKMISEILNKPQD